MSVMDFDLDFLKHSVKFIDSQLIQLETAIESCPDPDQFGLFYRAEQILGLGFVACQQYITTTRMTINVPTKDDAFSSEPLHNSGHSMASIINAGANFWKHSSEWKSGTGGARTRQILAELVGNLEQEYLLSNVFHALLTPLPLRFTTLLPFLVNWRDELRRIHGNGGYCLFNEKE